LDVERWTSPDREREVIHHPGSVAIVALTGDDHVVMVRQIREAVRDRILEIPAGIRDVEGEPPEETARRELREETGYRAEAVERIARIHTSPGFTDEIIDLYRARAEPEDDPEEGLEVITVPLSDAVAAVREGRITDAKTVVGVLVVAER
jgi:8-oxo-dGTP pyrophosphatase MutT (NUDIX family)